MYTLFLKMRNETIRNGEFLVKDPCEYKFEKNANTTDFQNFQKSELNVKEICFESHTKV